MALGDDFKTMEGKEYKDATVTHVEPDGIVVKTKSGISKLYFQELPTDVQQRFNYNPQQAASYSAAQSAAYSAQQNQEHADQTTGTAPEKESSLNDQQPTANTHGAVQGQRPTPHLRHRYTTVLHQLAYATTGPTPKPAVASKQPAAPNKPVHPAPVTHPKAHETKTHKKG